jgi:alcohol dehydrogenase class IV
MALANAKLGAVHGFAAPLGAMLGAAHGEICAALLPHVMEANIMALRRTAPGRSSLERYDEAARLLTGRAEGEAEDGVRFVRELCVDLGVSGLADLGLKEEQIPDAAEKAGHSSSMKGNPVALDQDELQAILRRAMQG